MLPHQTNVQKLYHVIMSVRFVTFVNTGQPLEKDLVIASIEQRDKAAYSVRNVMFYSA